MHGSGSCCCRRAHHRSPWSPDAAACSLVVHAPTGTLSSFTLKDSSSRAGSSASWRRSRLSSSVPSGPSRSPRRHADRRHPGAVAPIVLSWTTRWAIHWQENEEAIHQFQNRCYYRARRVRDAAGLGDRRPLRAGPARPAGQPTTRASSAASSRVRRRAPTWTTSLAPWADVRSRHRLGGHARRHHLWQPPRPLPVTRPHYSCSWPCSWPPAH